MIKVRVWDLPTRMFHWLLVLTVIGLVVTGNVGGNWMSWHFRLGYAAFTLLVFRVLWGMLGGHWSQFRNFVPAPGQLLRYLRGETRHSVGHNPLGALSVLTLLLVLTAQVTSGLLSDDEIAFSGPLAALAPADLVTLATWYHAEVGKLVMLALVAIHIAAIAFYQVFKKQNLSRAMLTGVQEAPLPPPNESQDNLATRLLAILLVCLSSAVVYVVIHLGGG